jgi:ABC-type glycerol-3-phosphate transport system substrate-binding protein
LAILVSIARFAVAGDLPKSPSNVVRIKVQGLPPASASGPVPLAQRAVLQRFLRDNPDIQIEPFVMPAIQGAGMDSTILMAIAAGVAPQGIYVNFRQSSTFIEKGFLVPLEVLLARVLSENPLVRETDSAGRWRADPEEHEVAAALKLIKERVPKPSWPVVFRPDTTAEDSRPHVWALPVSNEVRALIYRKDLFFEAGLDPERPPETWNELLQYARKLTDPERRRFGIFLPTGPDTSHSLYTFLVSMGVRPLEQNVDGKWVASYGNRKAAEAIRFAWDLIRGPFERDGRTIYGAAYTGRDGGLLWARGQIGMMFSPLQEEVIATVNPQLVGVAPVPASPLGIRAAEINAQMMGVFSRSTPQQQLAMMRYLWFLTGDEAKRLRTSVMVESGMGQFVNPNLLVRYGYEEILRQVPESWRQTFQIAMEEGVPEPYGSNTQNIYRYRISRS